MSSNKVNGKLDFRNVKQTQFDPGQTLKGSFSELQSSLRTYGTNAILKDAYTHFIQDTDVEGRPTKVEYYQAIDPAKDKLTFSADVGGSKAGTYFTLQEFITKRTHVFYYVVSGSGSAPGIGDIETPINIATNDPASVIALATKQVLNTIDEYIVTKHGALSSNLTLEYLQFGETEAVDVGTTGFLVTRIKDGESYLVGDIDLEYDVDGNPIYNGNTLTGLLYNPYTASFDVERSDVTANVDLNRPSNFSVDNIAYATAGTEVSIAIPDGTKRFKIKVREPNTQMTITNSSSGDYFTVPYGAFFEETNIESSSVTLFVSLSRDSRTIELLTWS